MPKCWSLTNLRKASPEKWEGRSMFSKSRMSAKRTMKSMRSEGSIRSTFAPDELRDTLRKSFRKLDEPLNADKLTIERMLVTKTGLVVTENNFLPLLH